MLLVNKIGSFPFNFRLNIKLFKVLAFSCQVRNYDFLNSIELMIFDQTEIFMMQNWDHILSILGSLN